MIGKRLGGRYEVEQRIGGGGMAVVYKAHDNLLNRTVALKILRSQFGHDDDFIGRFRREAQAAASLSHPNVVNVYDVGEEDDIQYIVMEYIEGLTLKELIIQKGKLDVEQAVHIAIQICDALEHAHHNHIIHRDIKPHNILIGSRGRVKVTDFGIARAVTSATITHTGSVIGSVHYFSPEQARGGISGEKSDLYSLGIVLYEMVTGQVPFSGDSPISVALKHLQENIIPPRELNPDIPQSLENVMLRALVKDPLHRYQSAKEMQRDLRTCLNPERLNEPPLVIEHDDDESTRVIPAITPEMMKQMEGKELFDEDDHRNSHRREGEKEKKPRKWVKSIAWISFLSAFFIAALYGFNFLIGIFYVPEVVTPRVEGMYLEEAVKVLKQKDLGYVIQERFNDEVPRDMVIRQTPPPSMRVKQKSEITLFVSKGQQQISMPDLVGLPERHIELQLEKFSKVNIERKPSNEYATGIVMAQEPGAGEMVTPSQTNVLISISSGKETVLMPELIGLTLEQAESVLVKNGLKKGKVKLEPSYVKKGIVFRQYPFQPGSQASPGAEIELAVSSGFPTDAKTVSEPVLVLLGDHPAADILILVTDARGKDIELVRRTIRQSDTFDVEVVLSPSQDATITIYKDGSLLEKRNIQYADVP
ncbi:Stk1 family PASTA domain-containing Ser/Thr kinase [Ammoniphilus sp. CFH 90114]|uniref:Stk1 family PASTA domain-containing Ser/Thr kinase n=1 Tax=Ammoniphilus sp. CFH 90114 TaxID=2493665 RepID=UPI00100F6BA5|nr:Stk1 family PASTA domain-containing Ser/Thr kinase [Ammoniphilus sp. CFH 90114]RXT15051.1 Stk1 family PASTA domain-containing Ser/Thr kinase [Ammoniphilus sp. CFH 90114]